jgi:hypothetical protein
MYIENKQLRYGRIMTCHGGITFSAAARRSIVSATATDMTPTIPPP